MARLLFCKWVNIKNYRLELAAHPCPASLSAKYLSGKKWVIGNVFYHNVNEIVKNTCHIVGAKAWSGKNELHSKKKFQGKGKQLESPRKKRRSSGMWQNIFKRTYCLANLETAEKLALKRK